MRAGAWNAMLLKRSCFGEQAAIQLPSLVEDLHDPRWSRRAVATISGGSGSR